MDNSFEKIFDCFPSHIQEFIKTDTVCLQKDIEEIRIRVNKPISIYSNGNNILLKYVVAKSDMDYILNRICNYSVYSYQEDINNGFVTTDLGFRIGVCGTAVIIDNKVTSVKNITSINIRLAKDVIGCSDKITSDNLENIIISGPPCSGKTTLLRDIARHYSNEFYKVCVVDERNEISGDEFDLGCMTDCLKGYKKAYGINLSIRTLSPQIIIFDEIGTESECDSILNGLNSGVNIITSVHCKNKKEFFNKKICQKLIDTNFFDKVVFLNKRVGIIDEILYLKRDV